MKLLVFQHVECEHPGSFRELLRKHEIDWHPVELDVGEPIPDLNAYDALWVMGGPMDVWDVEEHPWLIPEKAAIRKWVNHLRKPFLGLCLGHQLLADALGGTCGPQRPPEIGVKTINLTDEGRNDVIMSGLPKSQKCLQWHSVCVAQPPEGAAVLAESDTCSVQAMRVGSHAWSMQYHVEVEKDTVDNWAAIPAYHQALVAQLGEDGVSVMRKDVSDALNDFASTADRLFENFLGVMRRQLK